VDVSARIFLTLLQSDTKIVHQSGTNDTLELSGLDIIVEVSNFLVKPIEEISTKFGLMMPQSQAEDQRAYHSPIFAVSE
jgi:hypothetical protein